MNKESFIVTVNNLQYSVTPAENASEVAYKIETGCDYMFTLQQGDYGWAIQENDIKPIDEKLPFEIGEAIEQHING